MKDNQISAIQQRLVELRIIEERYRLLIDYIKEEAKGLYFDKDKLLNFIKILENKKDGKEDEEQTK